MKWEYLCARIDTAVRVEVNVALNSYGEVGWELVAVEHNRDEEHLPIFMFKRPLPDQPKELRESTARSIDMEDIGR